MYEVVKLKDMPLYELKESGVKETSYLMEVGFNEDYGTSDNALRKLNEYSNALNKLTKIKASFEDDVMLRGDDGGSVIVLNEDMLDFLIDYIDVKRVEAYNMTLNLVEYERNRNGFC